MSETVNEASSGGDTNPSGKSEKQEEIQNSRAFVEKTLKEKKAKETENEALRKQVMDLENEKLQAQGKDKELIASLQKQTAENLKKIKDQQSQFAQNVIFKSLEAEAIKQGCGNLRLFKKVAEEKLDSLEVDANTFEVSQESLTTLVASIATEEPMLFPKKVAGIKDAIPGGTDNKTVKLDVDNMAKTLKQSDFKNILAMKLGKK